jgi:PII-like signaling protein
MAGASVFRGFFGLDVAGQILESRLWSLVEHVPVVVEVADTPEAIADFLAVVETVVPEGLVTLQSRCVSLYRRSRTKAEQACAYLTHPDPDRTFSDGLVEGCLPIHEPAQGQVLKVFLLEASLWEGEPLYRTIVHQAQYLGLAGAAVFRSPLALGAGGQLRRATLFGSSRELPVVIEVVDTAAGVRRLSPFLDVALSHGLTAIEDVWVMRYRRGDGWSGL